MKMNCPNPLLYVGDSLCLGAVRIWRRFAVFVDVLDLASVDARQFRSVGALPLDDVPVHGIGDRRSHEQLEECRVPR